MKFTQLLLALTSPLLILILFASVLQTNASPSAAFVVNSTVDAIDANPGDGVCETAVGNGVCTLRAAVMEANALSGNDTITLPLGTFTFSLAGTDEDSAATGDLDITEDLSITGAGVEFSYVDANKLDRVFHNFPGVHLELAHLTIQNGYISSSGGPGGGISNGGTLILDNSSVFSNTTYTTPADGGGIYSTGILTLTATTIDKNVAQFSDGGGIYSTGFLYVANSTLSKNMAETHYSGGSVFSSGTAEIINTTFSQNNHLMNLGQMTIQSSTFFEDGVYGAVFGTESSVMTLTHTILDGSSCDGGGTFVSNGFNIYDGERCNFNEPGDTVETMPLLGPLADNGGATETHAPLAGSKAIDTGSNALCPLTDQRGVARPIDGDKVSDAICDIGAHEFDAEIPEPIIIQVNSTDDEEDANPGDMICETAVSNNRCTLRAAIQEGNQHLGLPVSVMVPAGTYSLTLGRLNITNSVSLLGTDPNKVLVIQADFGDVIRTDTPSNHPIKVANMTLQGTSNMFGGYGDIINNRAGVLQLTNTNVFSATYGSGSEGVGIYNFDRMSISNSTIAFNSRNIINDGFLEVTNSTIYSSTYGGLIHNGGNLDVLNSTFVESGISNFADDATVQNSALGGCSGNQVTSLGNNLDFGSSCNFSGNGDLVNTNPLLGDFVSTYGASTFEVLPNSPVIDAGSNINCPGTDQRHFLRPFDGDDDGTAVCDIGAVEYNSSPPNFVYLPILVKSP